MTEINELVTAMAKARASFPPIEKKETANIKTKAGYTYSYDYAPLSEILDKTAQALAANGLILMETIEDNESGTELTVTLAHQSGQYRESKKLLGRFSDPKEFGGAMTYYRRYLIEGLLSIASQQDKDAQGIDAPEPPRRVQQPTTEPPPSTQPARRATPTKPAHQARPMQPEQTRAFVEQMTEYKLSAMNGGHDPATPAARGLFVGKLTEVFAPNDDAEKMRRSVVTYLFGVKSSIDLTKAQVSAGLDWLIDHKTEEGEYIINAYAIEEARAIERQVLLDAGQSELAF